MMAGTKRAASTPWRYAEIAADLGVELRREEPLSAHTTMKVGGPAEWFYLPETPPQAAALHAELTRGPLPLRIIGAGSNLVVVDEGVRAAVISTRALSSEPELIEGTRVRVGAGQPVPGLVRWAASRGLAGLEFAEGIPAQVGGGIRMNAGANQSWFSEIARSVLLAGADGSIEVYEPCDADFGYRTSFVAQKSRFVVGAELVLVEDDPEEIQARIKSYRSRRRASQPLRDRSAGCVFANYDEQHRVGALVDRLDLKGRRRGGAEVSPIHGNFIVNRDKASAEDVLGLIDEVAEALRAEVGRDPRLEIEIWRDES